MHTLLTKDKKHLIAGAIKLLQDVLGENPKSTFVIIEDFSTDNWGLGGKSVSVLGKQPLSPLMRKNDYWLSFQINSTLDCAIVSGTIFSQNQAHEDTSDLYPQRAS